MRERHRQCSRGRRAQLNARRIDPGAERRAVREPRFDDGRHERSRDGDADPDRERQQDEQDRVRRCDAQEPARSDQGGAARNRRPRPDRPRNVGRRRREDPHAQHGDCPEQACHRVRDAELVLDRRDQRPGTDDLRPQGEGDQKERGDEARVLPQAIVS
jgi:hypothetical protein